MWTSDNRMSTFPQRITYVELAFGGRFIEETEPTENERRRRCRSKQRSGVTPAVAGLQKIRLGRVPAVALVMMVLSNNVVLALGLMAIFAMVRFRTILRDSLDTAYVLAVVVIGLACGTQKFATAVIGCVFTIAIMLYFWLTSFGIRHRYDIIVNLHWSRSLGELPDLGGKPRLTTP
jgi:hypothetical protein